MVRQPKRRELRGKKAKQAGKEARRKRRQAKGIKPQESIQEAPRFVWVETPVRSLSPAELERITKLGGLQLPKRTFRPRLLRHLSPGPKLSRKARQALDRKNLKKGKPK